MLAIVKGDILDIEITVQGVESGALEGIRFESPDLKIKQNALYDSEEGWYVRIEGNKTKDFPAGLHLYRVILILSDGQEFTGIPKDYLEVLIKPEVEDD